MITRIVVSTLFALILIFATQICVAHIVISIAFLTLVELSFALEAVYAAVLGLSVAVVRFLPSVEGN